MVGPSARNLFRKPATPHVAFFLILALFAATFYADVIGLLPVGIHDWAQGDRLALAISFFDNGMNFFRPATLSQFSDQGVVGVELPFQSYLAALLAKVTGRDSISVWFRLINIAISWVGLYALFRAVFDRSRNFLAALLPPLLFYCAPVFVVYSGNFLPDPAAVSFCFVGFFFFLKYADTGSLRAFRICIAWLTLAVLIKASTIGYLATLLGVGFYREAFLRKSRKGAITAVLCGLAAGGLFIAQYFHIIWLNEHFHSTLFTAQAHPFKSWASFDDFTGWRFKEQWMSEYFLLAEYPILMFVIAFGLSSKTPRQGWHALLKPLPFFLAAALLMLYLFGEQLGVHDYYMLAICYPLIGYALIAAMIRITRAYPGPWPKPVVIGTSLTLLLLYCLADHQIFMRNQNRGKYATEYSFEWVKGGAKILRDLGVPQEEQIVVAGDSPPNLALVYFDRKGYVMPVERWNVELKNGTDLLREKGLRYLVFREKELDILSRGKDSTDLREQYETLYRGEQKAVLRLKN